MLKIKESYLFFLGEKNLCFEATITLSKALNFSVIFRGILYVFSK
jgi:hypothetical protein